MIDLHCHVLHGIDDGSRDIEESIEMLRAAKELGFTGVVCTSHYKVGRAENLGYLERFQELKERVEKEKIGVKLYPGNEIFLGLEEIEALKDGKVNEYNRFSKEVLKKLELDSEKVKGLEVKSGERVRYILVELDPMMPFHPVRIAFERIIKMGYTPILAHIERYREIKISEFIKLRELGVLFQVNIASLGNPYRERVIKFLEIGLISFVTSDAHRVDKRTYLLKDEWEELKNIVGEGNFQKMCEDSLKIVMGEDLTLMPLKKIEKNLEGNEEKKERFFSRLMKKMLWKSKKNLGSNPQD